MARRRLLWRLFPIYLGMTLLALWAVAWHASAALRQSYRHQRAADLHAVADVLRRSLQPSWNESLVPGSLDAQCRRLTGDTPLRLTALLPDGRVAGDSQIDGRHADNHRTRPEVRQALAGTPGEAIRDSDSPGGTMLYVALPLLEGSRVQGAVRVAMSLRDVDAAVAAIRARILGGAALLAAAALAGSLFVSRRLVRPLDAMRQGAERFAAGDLASPLPVDDSQEIGRLADALNRMAAQLDERLRTVTRQRNEQEAILSSMTEGVLAVDLDQRVISINRSASRILGLPHHNVQGRSIQETIRNAALQRFVARAIASPEPVEAEIVLRDGGERALQVHGTVLADAARHVIGAVIVLNDISRLRRLEAIRTEFVANVSHELRTPITSIKGFVETLLDGALSDPQDGPRFLAVIGKQVDRLSGIIDDLLMLSRVEQDGEASIALQPGNLREILAEAIQLCTLKAEEKQIDVQLDCPAALAARMNPPLLEQAVVNLVDNALKYSESGRPIQVQAGCDDDGIFVRVVDSGCGIARQHLPRLFERFYRVDKARSRKLGGTGLGLSIVKHIVQAHGGQVSVHSTVGKGSTFTIRLPAPDPLTTAAPGPAPSPQPASGSPSAPPGPPTSAA